MNLEFDFTVNKANKTITVIREFAAELPLVWDAYSKREILEQWWAPKPWKARTKSMDFRSGGHWHYAMVGPNGEEHWSYTTYLKVKPKESFTGLDGFADENAVINKQMPQSKWEVSFTDKGDRTFVKIHISYDDLAQLQATIQMGFKEVLTMAMEGLDHFLASRTKK